MSGEAGKGSKQRPGDIDAYSKNWETIFGKKKQYEALDEMVRLTEEMGLYEDKDRRPTETGDSGNTETSTANKNR
jgi:hypothetical protein